MTYTDTVLAIIYFWLVLACVLSAKAENKRTRLDKPVKAVEPQLKADVTIESRGTSTSVLIESASTAPIIVSDGTGNVFNIHLKETV